MVVRLQTSHGGHAITYAKLCRSHNSHAIRSDKSYSCEGVPTVSLARAGELLSCLVSRWPGLASCCHVWCLAGQGWRAAVMSGIILPGAAGIVQSQYFIVDIFINLEIKGIVER